MTLIPYTRNRGAALDRLVDRTLFGGDHWYSSSAVQPQVDAHSDDEGLVVRLEVPGVAPERVHLEVQDRTLRLSLDAEDGPDADESGEKTSIYSRAFRVPADLDTTKVDAKLEYGVLTVRIPKAEAAKPRSVDIAIQ